MNIHDMIQKAKQSAPAAPSTDQVVDDLFIEKIQTHSLSWNDPSFFAGGNKKILEWNLKDMLKFCEEQFALKHGRKPDFAIRPAMMAMSGLRNIIETHFSKSDVNPVMRGYIEWYIQNMNKWWKGKPTNWYPQKMAVDARVEEFVKKKLTSEKAKVKNSISKRPVNPILIEEFYRGDPSDFVCAYGFVITAAFLIKIKDFSRVDAISFLVDASKRAISSGGVTFSHLCQVDAQYGPFERFEEMNPEELIFAVRGHFAS